MGLDLSWVGYVAMRCTFALNQLDGKGSHPHDWLSSQGWWVVLLLGHWRVGPGPHAAVCLAKGQSGWCWPPGSGNGSLICCLHSSMEFGLKLTCWNWAWVGMSSNTDRFKFPKWHLVGWCHHSRKTSSKWLLPNGYFQCSLSKGESQLPSSYSGGSPRSVSGSDPGLFQITAFVLEFGVCEILCAPCESGVPAKPCLLSKPDALGAPLPKAGAPGWGAWHGAQDSLL